MLHSKEVGRARLSRLKLSEVRREQHRLTTFSLGWGIALLIARATLG